VEEAVVEAVVEAEAQQFFLLRPETPEVLVEQEGFLLPLW
jgi:hypothetical protein